MIIASGVDVTLGERHVLRSVDFSTVDGKIVGLIGPNGSGKTTLLRCLSGALKPARGVVVVDGRDASACSARDLATHVAVVPQEQMTAPGMSVAQLVMLARSPHRRDHQSFTDDDRRIVADALDQVDALSLAARSITELSGGERQRVALARCLAQQTPVMFLDEPTNHLDVKYQHEVLSLTRSLQLTTIIVLHDLNLASRYCDELVLLDDGHVVRSGTADNVLEPSVLSKVYGITARRIDDVHGPFLVFG